MKSELNGALIAFDDEGQGPPILFIHAGIADRTMWEHQIAHFRQSNRVISLDLRGFGESDAAQEPFLPHEDARALLDHLGVERVAVVGISMGGDVAIDLALTHPERISHLIAVSTLAVMDEPSEALRANWQAAGEAAERGDLDLATQIELDGWIVGEGRSREELDPAYLEHSARMIRAIWERTVTDPEVEEIEPVAPRIARLAELTMPVLLIQGDRDFPDVSECMARLHAGIPGSCLETIANTAHLPPLERPFEFNRLLAEFLTARS
jgi:pimeloyl-ACP methyl ester carboxylesterase